MVDNDDKITSDGQHNWPRLQPHVHQRVSERILKFPQELCISLERGEDRHTNSPHDQPISVIDSLQALREISNFRVD
ncbi:hypothetical protein PILCRDRAFT_817039 [Piloderma croceum F 1598]|uniref:Uncharacterized protein n=1 Tax=Piloderma croceum (strain F 1598) TaxID=765440 RepID=A0A0C3FPB0_PILCF|nr:hypothetical protein PILCRDRAFT_817039 [Piloderma croceum F 1598]